jgi:hypothetical protein
MGIGIGPNDITGFVLGFVFYGVIALGVTLLIRLMQRKL